MEDSGRCVLCTVTRNYSRCFSEFCGLKYLNLVIKARLCLEFDQKVCLNVCMHYA